MDKVEIEELGARLAVMTEHDLLLELGALLVGDDGGTLRDGRVEDLVARAENWLERNGPRLRERVCDGPGREALGSDEVLEVAAVADLILDVALHFPGALTVAAILVRRGLEEWCANSDSRG